MKFRWNHFMKRGKLLTLLAVTSIFSISPFVAEAAGPVKKLPSKTRSLKKRSSVKRTRKARPTKGRRVSAKRSRSVKTPKRRAKVVGGKRSSRGKRPTVRRVTTVITQTAAPQALQEEERLRIAELERQNEENRREIAIRYQEEARRFQEELDQDARQIEQRFAEERRLQLEAQRLQEEANLQQQEQARQAELLRQEEMRRQVEARRPLRRAEFLQNQLDQAARNAFLDQPLSHMLTFRISPLARQFEEARLYDAGYQGNELARTAQYMTSHFPTTTVFHPENVDPNALVVSHNFKRPLYEPDFVPEALHSTLLDTDVKVEDVDARVIVQNMQANMLVRPHYGLDPTAPDRTQLDYLKEFDVRVGLFSKGDGGPLIQNQPRNGLLEDKVVLKNSRFGRVMSQWVESEPDNLKIENLDINTSRVVYSLTIYKDPVQDKNKALVVRHVLLNEGDYNVLQDISRRSNSPRQLVGIARVARGNFSNPDVADDLDLFSRGH